MNNKLFYVIPSACATYSRCAGETLFSASISSSPTCSTPPSRTATRIIASSCSTHQLRSILDLKAPHVVCRVRVGVRAAKEGGCHVLPDHAAHERRATRMLFCKRTDLVDKPSDDDQCLLPRPCLDCSVVSWRLHSTRGCAHTRPTKALGARRTRAATRARPACA
jgi:hypothetical protein